MIVREATPLDIETVIPLMRAADAREVYAGRFVDDPVALAEELVEGARYCIALLALCADDGEPVAIIGARLKWPNVASILMVATDRWGEIAFAATRWVKRVAIPVYIAPNCHRAQCEAWIGNHDTRAWLGMLGFETEGRLAGYGRNGEHFIQYAWLRTPARAGRG
jgi:hypothetical protein